VVKSENIGSEETEVSASVRMFNSMADKFDATTWPKEEDTLPMRERVRRIPRCMLRALPLALGFMTIYQIFMWTAQWTIVAGQPVEFFTWGSLRSFVVWTIFTCFLIGDREALYPEGIFKPRVWDLLKGLKANVWFPVFAGVLLVPLNWDDLTRDQETILDSIEILTLFLLVVATNETKAWKKPDAQKTTLEEEIPK